MTYKKAIEYLESFINYEKKDGYNYAKSFKLDRIRKLSSLLGNPHATSKCVHVAGSKGKGSTSVLIYSILRSAGFKVGLYTSPHLVSFRERIRVGSSLISEDDTAKLLDEMKPAIETFGTDQPTFFEVYTALAFKYFDMKGVDFAIYETGLGGRLDATNIVEPAVTAITPISYEHTDKLGSTLREIASEKGGIIKEGVACVSAPQEDEARIALEDICRQRNSKFILVGKDLRYEEVFSDDTMEVFNISGGRGEYRKLQTALLGSHQAINSAVAIGVIEVLKDMGISISVEAIRKGIASATWPGRLEVAGRRPYIVLDGAHNGASAAALANSIRKSFKYRNLILVFGISKDKDISRVVGELVPMSGRLVLTKSKVALRSSEPAEIAKHTERFGKDTLVTLNVNEALDKAISIAGEEDLVLVTGSLFVVGEARERLLGTECLI